jgi:hypothetical protein
VAGRLREQRVWAGGAVHPQAGDVVEHQDLGAVIGQPGPEPGQHGRVETGIGQLRAIAYFQSIARTAIAAACRSMLTHPN